jgi:hypothetical protein
MGGGCGSSTGSHVLLSKILFFISEDERCYLWIFDANFLQ